MGNELDRTDESPVMSTGRPSIPARVELVDPAAAIALAESMAGSQLLGAPDAPPEAHDVASTRRTAAELLRELERRAQRGERAAVIAGVRDVMSSRAELRALAQGKYGVVVHAIAAHGAEELSAMMDLGWAVLCASGPEDSFDLSVAARRAAEDSGVPFLVVHALADRQAQAGHGVATVTLPDDRACQLYLARPVERGDAGGPPSTPPADTGAAHVPFALASALRELGSLTGRRHDVFDRAPMGEPHLVLVGVGSVGDALIGAVPELRMRGYDVGALHMWSMRPFPGPRLVKALSRALAVAVLEADPVPLSQGGPLSRAVKVAFADALTWAPGYPGIGRIPKLFTGTVGSSFDVTDLASICDNMLADGRRTFSLLDPEGALTRAPSVPGTGWSARALFADEPSADDGVEAMTRVLLTSAGLRSHALVTRRGVDVVADVVASREPPRGTALRRPARLIVAQDASLLSAAALSGLETGGVVALACDGDGPSGSPLDALTEEARAMLRERRGRLVSLGASRGDRTAVAGAFAGATLAVAAHATRISVTLADGDAALVAAFQAAQEAVTVASRARDAAQVPLA